MERQIFWTVMSVVFLSIIGIGAGLAGWFDDPAILETTMKVSGIFMLGAILMHLFIHEGE